MGSEGEIAGGGGGGGCLLGPVNINNSKLAGNLKPSWYNIAYLLIGGCYRYKLPASVSFLCCEEKMPTCSVLGCKNRSEKDRVRGVSFYNLPVKKPLVASSLKID